MLHLKNIVKNDTQIQADYFPEGSTERGFVSVDIKSGEILDSDTTSYDNPFNEYLSHAAQALTKMTSENPLPAERLVMWY